MRGSTAAIAAGCLAIALTPVSSGAAASADAATRARLIDAPPTRLADSPFADALDDALISMALTRDDLSFRTDYADSPDSFRIRAVDELLERPLSTETYVGAFADATSEAVSLESLLTLCARELDLTPRPLDGPAPDDPSDGKGPGPRPLDVLLPAVETATELMDRAFAGLSEGERRFIALNAAVLLEEDEFDPDRPIDERDREAEEEERLGDQLLLLAAKVDYDAVAAAGTSLARAAEQAARIAAQNPAGQPRTLGGLDTPDRDYSALVTGDVWDVLETDAGVVILGGPGNTTYKGEAAVIIDVGGDDRYLAAVGSAMRDQPASVVIDLDGDDVYSCGHHGLGTGFMGIGVLIDLKGDDSYSAGDFSLGSGLFGVGLLLDREGDDSYTGDTCTEGSGAFGIGILRDEAGNDSYEAALFSQAFGFVMGAGLLHDVSGNDVYFAGGKYTDEIRYFDHYISLSQGFGFGWRPDASGGIGMLVDEAGNDAYVSDIFGQGSSYWFAIGGLVDYGGNDNYVSYQYAQGAGTHITVAALVDYEGDDNYVSKGVSQGCGHDLAIGLLHDLGGDDNYTCHDLSQAAGNANGIGVLVDDAGNDAYSVRNPENTHGYGNFRRDYGSVGLFLDCAGSDSYSGRGENGAWWTYSTHGVGVDLEADSTDRDEPEAEEAIVPPTDFSQMEAEVDTLELAKLSPAELFLRASSSALQFEHMREPSRVILVRDHERSLSYLVTRLDTDDARERHALENILVRIGEPAVSTVTAALSVEVQRTDTTRGARLAASVLGKLGDQAAVGALAAAHDHPDWKVRGAAAGALGRIGGHGTVPALLTLLADGNETVRKGAAVGFGRIVSREEGAVALDDDTLGALVDALSDASYSVRYSAAEALGKVGAPAVKRLAAASEDTSRLVRLMAVRALAGTGSRAALRPLTDLLSHEDWATRAFAADALGDIGPDRKARKRLEKLATANEHPLVSAKAGAALAGETP